MVSRFDFETERIEPVGPVADRWLWIWSLALLAIFVVIGMTAGCSAEYWTGRLEPTTLFQVNPITRTVTLKDSKNNDIRVVGLEFDAATKSFRVQEVVIKNNSSDVVAADTERMKYIVEAQEVQVRYMQAVGTNIAMALAAGGEAAASFIGKLPNMTAGVEAFGGSGSFSLIQPIPGPPAVVSEVEPTLEPPPAVPPPVTEPEPPPG